MKKYLVLLLPFFLFGCKEDEVKKTDSELLEANRQLLAAFFAEYEPQGTNYTVDADSAIEIVGDNATLSFSPHFFNENGDDVSGEIQIEFRELYHKSDFLFANKQTITNNGELLQSAGVFYIKATQNGEALKFRGQTEIDYYFSNIYPSLENSEANSMEIYSGRNDNKGNFEWINAEDPLTFTGSYVKHTGTVSSLALNIGFIDYSGPVRDSTFENLGWINCDDVLSDTLPTTSVSITITGNWGGEAVAAVYLVFKDINSVLNLYQVGSTFESPGNVPITFTATVVVIAVNDGAYYFGTKEITVAATNNITVPVAETSKADMAAAIKTLDD